VDPAIVDAINDRLDELVAFLRKSSADMTDAELAALGFRRNGDGVVMLVADVPEFEGAWSPPHGWGAGSPGPATRPDAARRKRPAAPAGTPLLDACDKEEREPIAEQDRAGGDATFEVPE